MTTTLQTENPESPRNDTPAIAEARKRTAARRAHADGYPEPENCSDFALLCQLVTELDSTALPFADPDDVNTYWMRIFGAPEYRPIAKIGRHSGTHPVTIRETREKVRELCPEASDVIAALVWEVCFQRRQIENLVKVIEDAQRDTPSTRG